MSAIAVALKHMLAADMPHDAIVAAVSEMEAASAPVRTKAAERQARYRERNKASQSVTGDVCDGSDALSLSLPPNEINSNPPTHTPENNTTRVRAEIFPMPDFADPVHWRGLLANRKLKRLANTEAAHDKLLRDIAAESARTGWPPGEVLRRCAEKGWGAVYKIEDEKNGQSKHTNQRGGSTRDAAQLALSRMGLG